MIVFAPNSKVSKFRVASGEGTLDGSNPTAVATGLSRIIAVSLTLKGSAAPGDSTQCLTYTTSGGTLSVYAWKNTSGSDPTLAASTGTESFSWTAVGY
jgi:hypothetical protein